MLFMRPVSAEKGLIYRVTFDRMVSQVVEVFIEAKSESEAREEAFVYLDDVAPDWDTVEQGDAVDQAFLR